MSLSHANSLFKIAFVLLLLFFFFFFHIFFFFFLFVMRFTKLLLRMLRQTLMAEYWQENILPNHLQTKDNPLIGQFLVCPINAKALERFNARFLGNTSSSPSYMNLVLHTSTNLAFEIKKTTTTTKNNRRVLGTSSVHSVLYHTIPKLIRKY